MSKKITFLISVSIFIFTFYFISSLATFISTDSNISPENSYIYHLIVCIYLLCSVITTCSFLILTKLNSIKK